MDISCCTWSFLGKEKDIICQLSDLDFHSMDIQTHTYNHQAIQHILLQKSIKISCLGLSFNMPPKLCLDSPNNSERQNALNHIFAGLEQGSKYGAKFAYVVPGFSADNLKYFSDSLIKAADLAQKKSIKLCVEHFPGRALPTAKNTLKYLNDLGHDNIYLLLDSGHLQISNENFGEIIESSGPQLGYVHLDDNNGKEDLHLPLCSGILTLKKLRELINALKNISYNGPLSLELQQNLHEPVNAMKNSKALITAMLDHY